MHSRVQTETNWKKARGTHVQSRYDLASRPERQAKSRWEWRRSEVGIKANPGSAPRGQFRHSLTADGSQNRSVTEPPSESWPTFRVLYLVVGGHLALTLPACRLAWRFNCIGITRRYPWVSILSPAFGLARSSRCSPWTMHWRGGWCEAAAAAAARQEEGSLMQGPTCAFFPRDRLALGCWKI